MIDHEQLRVRKFYADVLSLRQIGTPMPGTILDDKGKGHHVSSGTELADIDKVDSASPKDLVRTRKRSFQTAFSRSGDSM